MTATGAGFRTPLSRARGLGSAKHGVGHFIADRVTGLALIPLSIWAAFAGLKAAAGGYGAAVEWLAHPVNAVLLALFLVTGLVHLRLAIQVVIEDYIPGFVAKSALLIANYLVCVLGAALGVFAILKVALSGAF
ncbi:MAG TPA: succinate dehydrogenase, hydrophobic membrane anchor protein [Caulobacter sp.]|nr:succinate dehydrogenase, hydrophobic membrane anchor protein [Caulobacter sp.]